MSTATYKIPAENIGKLTTQIETLNRKVAKLCKKGYNFNPIVIDVDKTPIIEHKTYQNEDGCTTRDEVFYNVTVTGEEIIVSGWRFVATLQHEEGGTIIRSIPGTVAEGELSHYRNATPGCDHCQMNRRRNDTFVLRNESSRELKQVGRNCLEDFTGVDAHGLAIMAELLASLDLIMGSFGEGSGSIGFSSFVPLSTYLPFVAKSIREDGWLSRGAAYERGVRENSTADRSFSAMVTFFKAMQHRNNRLVEETKPTEKDRQEAADVTAYLSDHFESLDESALNDYQHNLRVTFEGQVVDHRLAGLAASMVSYVARQIQEKAEKTEWSTSEYIGELKKRMVLTLTCVYPSRGGRPGCFRDENGNKIQAWNTPDNVFEGQTYRIACTPVKHEVYKDVKSTMVNRLVLQK